MSLSRVALRLAAVEALAPSAVAETGPWPTWAGPEVYDSSITPISDADGWRKFVEQAQGKPIVTVYTEEQETTPIEGASYPAEIEVVDLVVEIMVAVGAELEVSAAANQTETIGSIEAAITSAQHEAVLDMLEQQIRNLLDPASAFCPWPYNQVAYELHHIKSVPMRDAQDRFSRQAARTLTFKVKVKRTQPFVKPSADVPPELATLPTPLLTVALALEPSSPAGQLVRQIARGQAGPPTLNPLNDIRIVSGLRGETPTTKTADFTSDVQL